MALARDPPGAERVPDENAEYEHRVRGRVAVLLLPLEGPAVSFADEDVGGASGLAAAHQIDDVEHIERPDHPEQHGGQSRA